MRCSKCSSDNANNAKFCIQCGASLTEKCPNCGFEDSRRSKFCAECGTPLHRPRSQSSGTGSSVSGHEPAAADELEQVPDGERKTVTALFADIKGSTEMMEQLDAEDVRALVDPALRLMSTAVQRFDGYLVQSTGDGIFALFGAPIANEQHPQLAVHAALEMQKAIKQYAARLVAGGQLPIVARVGINTGEVVLRTLRATGRAEYTPIGLTANLAQRLQNVAQDGSIVISESTCRLVEGYFDLDPLGPVALKGVTKPVTVFQVVGAGSIRTHFDLSARRGLTRFVGRAREIEEMNRALRIAAQGRGQIVAAVAEAGTGKSRLIHEFKQAARQAGLVLEGACVAHGRVAPYQPLLEALNRYFGIEPGDSPSQRRAKLQAQVVTLDGGLAEEALLYFFALLDVQDSPDPLGQMDAAIKQRRTLDFVKHLFLRESLRRPLTLVFEDVHWIDEETQAFLNLLADSIANSRILLMVSYRPEYRQQWSGKSYYTQLRLDPLDRESADAMLSAMMGEDAELRHLKRLIVEKTAGNPFFMEEMVQTLVEQGTLARNGALQLMRPVKELRVPTTVHGVLASRIDRLPAREKELLQLLAVVGKQFPLSLVRRLTSSRDPSLAGEQPSVAGEEELAQGLADLQLREFIYEQPGSRDLEYVFKHALTQEVAYHSVLVERRSLMHEQAACAIESLFAGQLEDHISDLAHHYSRSANVNKAAHYLYRAGRQSAGRSAHSEALAYFGDGLELLKRMPASRDRVYIEQLLQIGTGFSLRATKGFTAPEVEQALVRARELCSDSEDRARLYDVLVGLHTYYLFGPRLETSRRLAKELLSVAEQIEERTKIATAYTAMGQTATFLGEFRDAREYLEQAISIDPGNPAVAHNAIGYLAPTLWSLGYPREAAELIRTALDGTQAETRPLLRANVLAYGAVVSLRVKHWSAAREQAEAGRVVANKHGFLFHGHCFSVLYGRALTEEGALDQGLSLMRDGVAGLETMGAARPFLLGYLAEGCLAGGLLGEGLDAVARAEHRTEETGERWTWADLLRLKGELLAAQDSGNAAVEPCFRAALEIAESQGAKSYELRAALSLARHLGLERSDEARRVLAPRLGWFKEDLERGDPAEARLLLHELEAPAAAPRT
jgi:class 3 adenylate cyclase/tetratricopeptide (TPR) repeat protein